MARTDKMGRAMTRARRNLVAKVANRVVMIMVAEITVVVMTMAAPCLLVVAVCWWTTRTGTKGVDS
jgi:hypothetical protein